MENHFLDIQQVIGLSLHTESTCSSVDVDISEEHCPVSPSRPSSNRIRTVGFGWKANDISKLLSRQKASPNAVSCQSSKKLPKPTAGHGKREVGGLTLTQSIATTHKHEAVVRLYDAKAGYVECSLPKAQDKSFSGSLIVLEASECCGPLLSVVIKYLFACWLVHPMVQFSIQGYSLGTIVFHPYVPSSLPCVIDLEAMKSIYRCQDIQLTTTTRSLSPNTARCLIMVNTALNAMDFPFLNVRVYWNDTPLSINYTADFERLVLANIQSEGLWLCNPEKNQPDAPDTCLFEQIYRMQPTESLRNLEVVLFISHLSVSDHHLCQSPCDDDDVRAAVPIAQQACSKAVAQLLADRPALLNAKASSRVGDGGSQVSENPRRENREIATVRTVESIFQILQRSTNETLQRFCIDQLGITSLDELPNVLKERLLQRRPRTTTKATL